MIRSLTLVVFAIVLPSGPVAAPADQLRPDWASFLSDAGVNGTIVVVDARSGRDMALRREGKWIGYAVDQGQAGTDAGDEATRIRPRFNGREARRSRR